MVSINILTLISVFLASVSCQLDINTLNLINATQTLQDLERYGIVSTNKDKVYPNIYPSLLNTTIIDNKPSNLNGSAHNIPVLVRPINVTRPASIQKFINNTMSSIPSGICIKEVPTVSLLKKNDVLVAGNGSDPSLSRIQFCCDGYQRSAFVFRKCDPICSKGCGDNGICVAPETCTCFPDYVKNFEGVCVLTCPHGCENGICNYDNTCRCNPGYVPDSTGKICSPKCENICSNGYCSGSNRCSCKTGFVKDLTDPMKCVPSCSPPCVNGVCSGPNMCLCYSGYVKDRNQRGSNKCVKQ